MAYRGYTHEVHHDGRHARAGRTHIRPGTTGPRRRPGRQRRAPSAAPPAAPQMLAVAPAPRLNIMPRAGNHAAGWCKSSSSLEGQALNTLIRCLPGLRVSAALHSCSGQALCEDTNSLHGASGPMRSASSATRARGFGTIYHLEGVGPIARECLCRPRIRCVPAGLGIFLKGGLHGGW